MNRYSGSAIVVLALGVASYLAFAGLSRWDAERSERLHRQSMERIEAATCRAYMEWLSGGGSRHEENYYDAICMQSRDRTDEPV